MVYPARLAPHDLGDALVAHAKHLGDIDHWQAVFVGGLDCLVTLGAKLLGCLRKLPLALGKALGKGS